MFRFHLLLCLLVSLNILSAQSISGIVLETANAPLPSAQILLRQGGKISAFTMSDNKGEFTLDVSTSSSDSSMIEVRYFGYNTYTSFLSDLDLQQRLTVVLAGKRLELKEVVVSAKALPQIKKGDTLIYQTDAYRDGTEKKIEEVIAKLPGAEIDEAGNIKIKGKALDRILLDGEDLFDKNYKLLSKNVPADFVDRIDVMENHHQDELIGDLSGQKELALNLHLDPEKKRPLFGEIGAELGNSRTKAAYTNLFHLGKKVKTVNFSDYGTLGEKSGVGTNLLYRSQGLNSRVPSGVRTVLKSAATRQYRLVRPMDYLNNEAYGTAQTILFPLGSKAKNRFIFNASGENFRLEDDRLQENVSLSQIDTFSQQNNYSFGSKRFWFVNDFDVLLNRKSRVDFRFSMTGSDNSAKVKTLNELLGTNDAELLGTDLEERPLSYLTSLRYVRRLNAGTALRLSVSSKKEVLKQHQLYKGSVYEILPGLPESPELEQLFNQNLAEIDIEANVLQQIGRYKLNHTVGYRNNKVITETELAESNVNNSQPDAFSYILREAYFSTSANRKIGNLRIVAGSTVSRFELNADLNDPENKDLNAQWAVQANLDLQYDLNRRNKLRVWANSRRENQRADQLITSPYLASGNSLNIGLDSSYLIRKYGAGIGYSYSNIFKQYGYGVDFSYHQTPNGIRSTILTENFIVLEQLVPGFSSEMTSASVRADKYFAGIKTNLKLSFRYNRMNDQLSFGDNLVPVVTESQTLNLQASTKLTKKIIFGVRVDYSAFTNRIVEEANRQRQMICRQHIVFRPQKHIKANLKYDLYLPRLGTSASIIHLIGIEVDREFSEQRLSLSCGVRNLLNVRTIEERSISVYQRNSQKYNLRPRTVYFSLTKSF